MTEAMAVENQSINNMSNTQLMGVVALFKASWEVCKERWKPLLAILFMTVLAWIGAVFIGTTLSVVVFPLAVLIIPAVFFAVVLIGSLYAVAQILAVSEDITYREALQKARPYALSMFGLSLLVGLVVTGGLLLFIVPGIIFALWFSQATYVLVLEKTSVTRAMGRSRALVQGRMMPILVRYFVLFMAYAAADLLIGALFSSGTAEVTPGMDWAMIIEQASENVTLNPVGGVLRTVLNLFYIVYAVAFGYTLYKDLVSVSEPVNRDESVVS